MVDDLVKRQNIPSDIRKYEPHFIVFKKHNISEDGETIILRHYPHANAMLPAITASMFDEIILPK